MAATDLTAADLKSQVNATQPASNVLIGTTPILQFVESANFQDSTGVNRATRMHVLQYALTGAQTVTLDLNAGTLVDANGDVISFARLFYVKMAVVNDGVSVLGAKLDGAAANVITDVRGSVTPGNFIQATNFNPAAPTGWVLVNATADKIVLVNLDAALITKVNLVLIGAAT